MRVIFYDTSGLSLFSAADVMTGPFFFQRPFDWIPEGRGLVVKLNFPIK